MPEDEYEDVDPIVGGVRWRPLTRSDYHVDPAFAVRPVKRDRDGEPVRGREKSSRPPPRVKSPEDLTELHGIPEDALIDPLRTILMEMIDEAGALHEQLLAAEDRIDYLEEHSRYDRLGNWLSTAAMLGQIRHLTDLDRREGVASSIAGIAFSFYRNPGETGSWSGAEKRMAKMGAALSEASPSGDVVGRLWDGAFGILLPGLDAAKAQALVDELAERCAKAGESTAVRTAIVPVLPDEEPEQAVDRLYAALTRTDEDRPRR
ncbi:MAG: hypothetical protein RIM72_21815 [Alphaproteobacteria bacterium]